MTCTQMRTTTRMRVTTATAGRDWSSPGATSSLRGEVLCTAPDVAASCTGPRASSMSNGDFGNVTVGVIQTPVGGIDAEAVNAFASDLTSHDLLVFPEMANVPYFPLNGVDAR